MPRTYRNNIKSVRKPKRSESQSRGILWRSWNAGYYVANVKNGLADCFAFCVVICQDRSCASRTRRPVASQPGWISVKQTVCTSHRACEIIYLYAVLLSNCHCLLFPVRRRLLTARLFFSTEGFKYFKTGSSVGFPGGCTGDSFHLDVAHGKYWREVRGRKFGSHEWVFEFNSGKPLSFLPFLAEPADLSFSSNQ